MRPLEKAVGQPTHRACRLAEADSLFRASIAMDQHVLGPDHVNVAGVEVSFARLLIARHQYALADSVLRDAIRIGEFAGASHFPAPIARKLLEQLPRREGRR